MEIPTFKFVLLALASLSILDATFTQAEDSEHFFSEHDFDEDGPDVPHRLSKDEIGYSNLNVSLLKNGTFTQGTENSFEEAFEEVKWSTNPPRESVKKRAQRKPKIMSSVVKKLVLTGALRRSCLIAHNKARKFVKPPASNMRKLHWDKDLEALATAYSRKCLWKHNKEKTHKRFDWVGENLFISSGIKFDEEYTTLAVKYFDDEKEFYNHKKNNCQKGQVCGHYTQVVWADTFRLGCGATQCANVNVGGKIWKKATLLVCNYTPGGNHVGVKPYKTGKRCAGCHKTDTCAFGNLCSNQMRGSNFNNATMINFTEWGPWGPCYATCGKGIKFRQRTCNTFVREDCEGKFTDGRACWVGPCNEKRNKARKNSPKNKNSKRHNRT
ncbi:cysteine-rich secretory protein LCCL domain-containing 2-like [Styela clava]